MPASTFSVHPHTQTEDTTIKLLLKVKLHGFILSDLNRILSCSSCASDTVKMQCKSDHC